jgi:hypothetical protein
MNWSARAGTQHKRGYLFQNLLPTVISVILIASVILLIMDLDRPRRGLIKVSQQSMVDLQDSLKRIAPSSTDFPKDNS